MVDRIKNLGEECEGVRSELGDFHQEKMGEAEMMLGKTLVSLPGCFTLR